MPGTITDPIALIESLSPEQIVDRLQSLDRESRALRVLLRAVRAQRRGQQQAAASQLDGQQEAAHA